MGGGSSGTGLWSPNWSAGGATRRWMRRSTSVTMTWWPSCATTTPSTALRNRPRTSRTWRRTWTGCCDGQDGGEGSYGHVTAVEEDTLSSGTPVGKVFQDATWVPDESSRGSLQRWKAPRRLTRCCRFLYRCSCFYFTCSVFTPSPSSHQFSSFVGRCNKLPVGF